MLPFRYALRNLVRRPLRTALTLVGLGAIAFLVAFMIRARGIVIQADTAASMGRWAATLGGILGGGAVAAELFAGNIRMRLGAQHFENFRIDAEMITRQGEFFSWKHCVHGCLFPF
jgi:hypothetical protein